MGAGISSKSWRRRVGVPAGLIGLVVSGAAGIAVVNAATTPVPAEWFTVQDVNGANDVPLQSDLTQMGRKVVAGTYSLFWSWDSVDLWTGSGQTGDACALFDYNSPGDGKIDAVVCGQVTNPTAAPTTVVQNHAPYVFRCDNSRSDRCGQPSAPRAYGSGVIAAGPLGAAVDVTDPNGTGSQSNLITTTDPFDSTAANGPGSNYDSDATLQVDVTVNYLKTLAVDLGRKYPAISSADPTLVNVCSYPSAGNGGNNNPFDCIAAPGSGFLKIVKNSGTPETFGFNVSPVPTGRTNPISLTTTGTTGATAETASLGMPFGTSNSVTEVEKSGWNVTALSCSLEGGASTGSGVTSTRAITGIRVESGKLTTCTFTNARSLGSLVVKKTIGSTTGAALTGATFTLTGSDDVAQNVPERGTSGYHCLDGLPVGNTYTLAETAAPADYNRDTATYSLTVSGSSTCADRFPTSGSPTVDKTVVNTRKVGSIAIQKVKGDGTALSGAAFSVTKVSGEGTSGAQTVPAVSDSTGLFCIAGLPTGGVYSIQETTTPNGYNTVTSIPNVTVVENTCSDAATRTTAKVTVTNNPAPGTINISKIDDQATDPRTPLGGAVFTLYKDTAQFGTWQTSETTTQGTAQTTSSSGQASFESVPLGKYCVVETTTPAGYATADPQCVEVVTGEAANTGQTITLTFEDPRLHKVLVIVCHEGTNKLDPSSVTLGTGAGATKTSLAANQLPTGWTEAQVCALGGASYGGLGHGQVSPSVTPN